jgi:hypothetical protein
MQITGKFIFERETKNTIRYMEVDEEGMKISPGAPIGTIYISKSALPRPFPQSLTVTVEA